MPPDELEVLEAGALGAGTRGIGTAADIDEAMLAGVAVPSVMPWPVRLFLIAAYVVGSFRKAAAKVDSEPGPASSPIKVPPSR